MNSCMALSEDESSTTNRDYGYSDFAKAFLAVHIPTMYLDYRIEAYDLFYCIDHEYAYVHSGSDEVEHETQIRTKKTCYEVQGRKLWDSLRQA